MDELRSIRLMKLGFSFTPEFTPLKRIAGQGISVRLKKDVFKQVESSEMDKMSNAKTNE
jgi:hypothetical protein